MMYIPQDIVDLVVDQLVSVTPSGDVQSGIRTSKPHHWYPPSGSVTASIISSPPSPSVTGTPYRNGAPEPNSTLAGFPDALAPSYEVGFRSPLDIDVPKAAPPHLALFRNLLELDVTNVDHNFTFHEAPADASITFKVSKVTESDEQLRKVHRSALSKARGPLPESKPALSAQIWRGESPSRI